LGGRILLADQSRRSRLPHLTPTLGELQGYPAYLHLFWDERQVNYKVPREEVLMPVLE
jgi:hypothetical protein